uniref:Sulfotransferase n=1 Tax=Paramoeba aestuarina TaxID=180227 RepID=A0A7S4NUU5_9EUKA|mmetsp:Transcript_27641/g.42922  ORF Transcript_27641/g.42922 Transcript_27641/m.42922 type:complete len:272 (+) Transcript_27641:40-855(+)
MASTTHQPQRGLFSHRSLSLFFLLLSFLPCDSVSLHVVTLPTPNTTPTTKNNFFFIHIAKTGGTTLTKKLSYRHAMTDHPGTKAVDLKKVRHFCRDGGYSYSFEFDFKFITSKLPPDCLNRTLFFSLVRNPKSWLKSAYLHTCRNHQISECSSGKIIDLINSKKHYFAHTPFQSRYLGHLFESDYPYVLCRTECFPKCLEWLEGLLGVPLIDQGEKKSNVAPLHQSHNNSEAEIDEIVRKYYHEDVRFYNSFGGDCFQFGPHYSPSWKVFS